MGQSRPYFVRKYSIYKHHKERLISKETTKTFRWSSAPGVPRRLQFGSSPPCFWFTQLAEICQCLLFAFWSFALRLCTKMANRVLFRSVHPSVGTSLLYTCLRTGAVPLGGVQSRRWMEDLSLSSTNYARDRSRSLTSFYYQSAIDKTAEKVCMIMCLQLLRQTQGWVYRPIILLMFYLGRYSY